MQYILKCMSHRAGELLQSSSGWGRGAEFRGLISHRDSIASAEFPFFIVKLRVWFRPHSFVSRLALGLLAGAAISFFA